MFEICIRKFMSDDRVVCQMKISIVRKILKMDSCDKQKE